MKIRYSSFTLFTTLFTLLFLTLTLPANGQLLRYKVNGKAPHSISDGERVYLIDISTNLAVDSAEVAGGTFYFEGKIVRPSCFKVEIPNRFMSDGYTPISHSFVLEEGVMVVDFSNSIYEGTPLNRELNDFLREDAALRGIEGEREALSLKYIERNSNNPVAVYIIRHHLGSLLGDDPKLFELLYSKVGEYVREFPAIKAAHATFSKLSQSDVGQPYINFTLESGNGKASGEEEEETLSLSDFVGGGDWLLLHFVASWSSPCKEEVKEVLDLYQNYIDKPFRIVLLSVWESREEHDSWIAQIVEERESEQLLEWETLYDEKGIAATLYGIDFLPHTVLINPEGEIVSRDFDKTKELLKQLFD